jgi:hypothetical protein
MRTSIFLIALTPITALSLVGCNWTEFDDLADTTWVRSTKEPNIGSRNYGLAILGVGTTANGGQLAVISDDTPDYSTIDYAADGTDTAGGNDLKLGQHRIAALTDPPLFTTDGQGKIALAERSTTGGNVAVVFGSVTAPAGQEFPAPSPEAITFVGPDIVIAASNTFYTLQGSTPAPCPSNDTTFVTSALAADAGNVWIWARTGAFFSVPAAALTGCTGGMVPSAGAYTTPLMPAIGARIHLVGNHAILTAHAQSSKMGQVFVVDISNPATPVQTDMLTVEGLRSSTLLTVTGATTTVYVAVGVPDAAVDSVIAGRVDVHSFDAATGKLSATAQMQLTDAEPESGQLFGRSVTAMQFNGQQILVVAGKSEVFAYYKTALYDALP